MSPSSDAKLALALPAKKKNCCKTYPMSRGIALLLRKSISGSVPEVNYVLTCNCILHAEWCNLRVSDDFISAAVIISRLGTTPLNRLATGHANSATKAPVFQTLLS